MPEDACHWKRGQAQPALAVINHLMIGLVVRLGGTNLAEARRFFDTRFNQAKKVIWQPLADF